MDPRYTWYPVPTHKPISNIQYKVDRSLFLVTCPHWADACAERNYILNTCTIYSPAPLGIYLDWHERKHCAGYDHWER